MKHVVMFSGGIGSWAAAKRLSENVPVTDITLLFTDTLIEDEDLYRFLDESAANVGAPLVRIADGRTPWQVFRDRKFIGNSRIAPCSTILKQDMAKKWIRATFPDPSMVTINLGIDWTESHRLSGVSKGWSPYTVEAPLCSPPYSTKRDFLKQLNDARIEPPRLYALGFPHNNCGGFCVRAGRANFALLLQQFPERYAAHEKEEERTRRLLGQGSILRNTDGSPLTLRTFRRNQEVRRGFDKDEWGGCGCFLTEDEEDV